MYIWTRYRFQPFNRTPRPTRSQTAIRFHRANSGNKNVVAAEMQRVSDRYLMAAVVVTVVEVEVEDERIPASVWERKRVQRWSSGSGLRYNRRNVGEPRYRVLGYRETRERKIPLPRGDRSKNDPTFRFEYFSPNFFVDAA